MSNKRSISHLGVNQKRVSITAFSPNKVLDVRYPKGKFGSVQTGATWIVQFPKAYEQLSLEYKVMFKEGFLFTREGLFGGKLPGLMGGETISGGATADGRNGWTSRLMWGQMGRGLGYLYYPDMSDDKYNKQACPHYGLDHELCVIKRNKYFTFEENSNRKCLSEWAVDEYEFRFKTEHFYKVKQQIKMNTLPDKKSVSPSDGDAKELLQGNRDGELKIWVDDKLVVNCNNIRFRDVPELAIDALLFNTFFGGNTAESSAHPRDETIYFDDVLISTE